MKKLNGKPGQSGSPIIHKHFNRSKIIGVYRGIEYENLQGIDDTKTDYHAVEITQSIKEWIS